MDTDQIRVTTADRDRAVAALKGHFEAGRLDAFEYEDRRGRAADAEVRAELDVLFDDLRGSDAAPVAVGAPADARHEERESSWCYGGFGRGPAYTLVPLVATALFFFTQQWVWFLLIPAAGHLANATSRRDGSRRPSRHRS